MLLCLPSPKHTDRMYNLKLRHRRWILRASDRSVFRLANYKAVGVANIISRAFWLGSGVRGSSHLAAMLEASVDGDKWSRGAGNPIQTSQKPSFLSHQSEDGQFFFKGLALPVMRLPMWPSSGSTTVEKYSQHY